MFSVSLYHPNIKFLLVLILKAKYFWIYWVKSYFNLNTYIGSSLLFMRKKSCLDQHLNFRHISSHVSAKYYTILMHLCLEWCNGQKKYKRPEVQVKAKMFLFRCQKNYFEAELEPISLTLGDSTKVETWIEISVQGIKMSYKIK